MLSFNKAYGKVKMGGKFKFIALFVGILCISLIAQIFYIIPYIRNQAINETKVHQEEIVRNIAREVDICINRTVDRLIRMSELPEFCDMDIDAMQKIIDQQEKLSERISAVLVLDSNAIIVCSSEPEFNETIESYLMSFVFTTPFDTGETFFSKAVYSKERGLISTSICIPVEAVSGERIGVLVARISINMIVSQVTDFPLSGGQTVSVIDNEGRVLAESSIDLFSLPDGPLSLSYSYRPMAQSIMKGEESRSHEYEEAGIKYFCTHILLDSNSWGIIVCTSFDSILADVKNMSRVLIFMNIILFSIALIITIVISRQISTLHSKAETILQKQTKELIERNEELNDFTHTVAHDLKTPLGNIIGFADIANEGFDELSDEEIQSYLGYIIQLSDKARRIIDSLLLFARVREAEIDVEELDMRSIISESIKSLSQMIKESKAEISFSDELPVAVGYTPWIEEVWTNYLSNAIKYGGKPPRIEIGADSDNSEGIPNGMVRYWVHDNGQSISDENQKLLFRKFERLDQIKTEGHGLGLSIVRRIINKLGGQVGVESSTGQGSLFYFTLPKKENNNN